MLVPQNVFKQAQARLSGRARSGSLDSISSTDSTGSVCSVASCDEACSHECIGGPLCSAHTKSVERLMASSFARTKNVPPALLEQRTRLLTAVVSARLSGAQADCLSPDSATDLHHAFIPFAIGRTHPLHRDEEDARSDKALEDAHINAVDATPASLPVVLPWKGPSRLASIVESDEEDS